MCGCVFTMVQMCMVVCDTVCGSSGKGYFMHFSTTSAQPADRASLESQWLYSKPGTHCLQFFLHQSGASDDILNIWVRDYDQADPSGKLTLIRSITGMRDDTVPGTGTHINLNGILETHTAISAINLNIYLLIVLICRDLSSFTFTGRMWRGQEVVLTLPHKEKLQNCSEL